MTTLMKNFVKLAAVYFTLCTFYFLFGGMSYSGRNPNMLRDTDENTESRNGNFDNIFPTAIDTASNCKHCIDYRQYKTLVSPEITYDIVLLITSSHRKDAAERRQVIRSTWANNSYYLPLQVQHVFVLGEFICITFISCLFPI